MNFEKVDFNIRVANLDDVDIIVELTEQLGYQTNSKEVKPKLNTLLNHDEHVIYVAEIKGRSIVGWVHAYLYRLFYTEQMIQIGGLVVDKKYRRLGIGKKLMKHCENWAKEKDCKAVILRSQVKRDKAHSFYKKIGYEMIKEQKTFYKEIV